MKKVLLAYSGGLDTSYCVKYLSAEKGLEVHCATVDTGGFSAEDLAQIEARALELGAASFQVLDARQDYYHRCLRFLVFGNVLRNQTYPLSVSAERVFQAIALADCARQLKADYIAHGSTGAGNDQVRFDVIFQTLIPEIGILTPIRDQRLSRQAEIDYLKAHGAQGISFEKALYSVNQGLWGTTVGGKETLRSLGALPEEAYPVPVSATGPVEVRLGFEKGELVLVDGQPFAQPLEAIQALEALAAPYGIGRDIHVGDTVIGIKGRVAFQAAAPLLVIKAHHLLEKHTLTKWQLCWKEQLAVWYGHWLHEGQFLDPALRDIEAFFESTQRTVTGTVHICLHPYRFELLGVESAHDLMDSRFGAYGEENKAWTGEDVKGFSKIAGNQTAIYFAVNPDALQQALPPQSTSQTPSHVA